MIFSSVNEDGIPAWKLVLEGKKTVTRRSRPKTVGKDYAIQPHRTSKAIGRFMVTDCETHVEWLRRLVRERGFIGLGDLQREAELEGLNSWESLESYFTKSKIDINKTYRIEFIKLKN